MSRALISFGAASIVVLSLFRIFDRVPEERTLSPNPKVGMAALLLAFGFLLWFGGTAFPGRF